MEPQHALRKTTKILIGSITGLITPVFLMSALAYGQASTSFKSNEVHADGSITFRYKDPAARKVLFNLEGAGKPLAMRKDSDGVWSVVTPPLRPGIYG